MHHVAQQHHASCAQLLYAVEAHLPQVALESIQAPIVDLLGRVFQWTKKDIECVQLQNEGVESGLDPSDPVE